MILETWKPYGITTVDYIKSLKAELNVNKITFVGRLDPLAQGILKVFTDADTKLARGYMNSDKTYRFDMILGIDTESHDCLSKINRIGDTGYFRETHIKHEFDKFVKMYTEQEYPLVSSYVVTHDNIKNPLWWFYSKGYRDVLLPKKGVSIQEYTINDVNTITTSIIAEKCINRINCITTEKLQQELNVEMFKSQWQNMLVNTNDIDNTYLVINIEMTVSSGFYIRRFCHDFGKYLGTGGIAVDITRTNIK